MESYKFSRPSFCLVTSSITATILGDNEPGVLKFFWFKIDWICLPKTLSNRGCRPSSEINIFYWYISLRSLGYWWTYIAQIISFCLLCLLTNSVWIHRAKFDCWWGVDVGMIANAAGDGGKLGVVWVSQLSYFQAVFERDCFGKWFDIEFSIQSMAASGWFSNVLCGLRFPMMMTRD